MAMVRPKAHTIVSELSQVSRGSEVQGITRWPLSYHEATMEIIWGEMGLIEGRRGGYGMAIG